MQVVVGTRVRRQTRLRRKVARLAAERKAETTDKGLEAKKAQRKS
ncbi:MAG: hypothetical protein ACYDAD_12750 [Acidimicrobiales bacterium]